MKKIAFALPVLFFAQLIFSQNKDYAALMEDSSATYFDIQNSFNANWKGRNHKVKGKGWKAFKRWEYFHRSHLVSGGKISNGYINFQERKKYFGSANTAVSAKKLSAGTMVAGNWTYIGPPGGISTNGGAGRTTFVRFDPTNSNIMYCGSPAGGLWKSTTGGNNWTVMADQIAAIGCTDMVVDPSNTNIMYLASGDGDAKDTYSLGILKSTDGGATWNTTGLVYTVQSNNTISKLLINPNNPQELWAATSTGLLKTSDGGINWVLAKNGNFRDIEFNPANPNTVFAVAGSTFYVTRNGGVSWTLVPLSFSGNVGRTCLAVTPADTNYVYVLAGRAATGSANDYGFLGISKSTDGAQSFSVVCTSPNIMGWATDGSDQGGQAWYDIAIACSPTNKNHILTGGVQVWESTNGGSQMDCLTDWGGWSLPYVHADVHAIEFLPGSNTNIYVGCDGGVFQTTNSGGSWNDVSTGLHIAQMYRLGVSQTNAALTIGGWQDNGTNLHNGTGCSEVMGGDGFESVISWANANIMYAEVYYGSIGKSTNGGNSFNNIVSSGGTGVDEDGDWNTPYVQHPTTANTLLVGKNQVYRSTNAGTSWTTVGSISTPVPLTFLTYALSNPSYIYASSPTSLFVSTNGTSFTNKSATLPSGISAIAVDATYPSTIWICSPGYSAGSKVYFSTDAGSTWQNYSTGLPNVPCHTIVYNGGNDGLYLGTDVGVFYRDTTMNSWIAFSNGLPNVVVDELDIQTSTGKLRAATYGRGLWETDLYSAPTAAPVAAFNSNRVKTCTNQLVDFYDQSSNLPYSWSWTFTGGTPATSTNQFPTVTYAAPGIYPVKLVVTNQLGSDSIASTSYIQVFPNPVAYAGADTTICKGDTIQLQASGGTSYVWGIATTLSNVFISNPLVYPFSNKQYTVTALDTNGCKSTDNVFISVTQPFATPSITVSGGNTLTAVPNGANYTYQWYYGGNLIPGATNSTLTGDSTGAYTVVLSDTAGCFSISSAPLNFVGMNEIPDQVMWSVFPNPSKGQVNISGFGVFFGTIRINIYGAGGNLVFTDLKTGKYTDSIQLKTDLAAGTYMVEIKDSTGKFLGNRRLVVVHD